MATLPRCARVAVSTRSASATIDWVRSRARKPFAAYPWRSSWARAWSSIAWPGSAPVPPLETSTAPTPHERSSSAWRARSRNGDRQMFPVQTVRIRAGVDGIGGPLADALELGGEVALQRLPDGGHVHRPHQVGVDQAVEAGRGVVLLGLRAAQHPVGAQLDLGRLGLAVVELDDPRRVGEEELDLPVGERPPEPQLGRQRSHLVPRLVEEPGAAVPLEERAAVVADLDLLPEVGRLDRGVADDARALPAADQPGQGRELTREVG